MRVNPAAFNVVMTYLFMHGSAVLVWIGMATAVPISYLFFSIKAIQDPPAEVREDRDSPK
jgi:hypothetical protein